MSIKLFKVFVIVLVSIIVYSNGLSIYIHFRFYPAINYQIYNLFLLMVIASFDIFVIRYQLEENIEEISGQAPSLLPKDYRPLALGEKGFDGEPTQKTEEETPLVPPEKKSPEENLIDLKQRGEYERIEAEQKADLDRIALKGAVYKKLKEKVESDQIEIEPANDLLTEEGPKESPAKLKPKKTEGKQKPSTQEDGEPL
jgi:hypothetical protein